MKKYIYRIYITIIHILIILLFVFIIHFRDAMSAISKLYILESGSVITCFNPYVHDQPDEMVGVLRLSPEEQWIIQNRIETRLYRECQISCDFICFNSCHTNAKIILRTREDIHDTEHALRIINEEFSKIARKYVGDEIASWYFSGYSDWTYAGRVLRDSASLFL